METFGTVRKNLRRGPACFCRLTCQSNSCQNQFGSQTYLVSPWGVLQKGRCEKVDPETRRGPGSSEGAPSMGSMTTVTESAGDSSQLETSNAKQGGLVSREGPKIIPVLLDSKYFHGCYGPPLLGGPPSPGLVATNGLVGSLLGGPP